MTKDEIIADITACLTKLGDADLERVATIVTELSNPPLPSRTLSSRERELLDASRRDFAEGRTLTMDDSKARTDALFARLVAQQQKIA